MLEAEAVELMGGGAASYFSPGSAQDLKPSQRPRQHERGPASSSSFSGSEMSASSGSSKSSLVVGHPGSGKSSVLWNFLTSCRRVEGWKAGETYTGTAKLVVIRHGQYALPRELGAGVVTYQCIAMFYVPRRLWTRATEILHGLEGADGYGCWDANVGGCKAGSEDEF